MGWTPKFRTTKFSLKKWETSLCHMVFTCLHTIRPISFCQNPRVWQTDGQMSTVRPCVCIRSQTVKTLDIRRNISYITAASLFWVLSLILYYFGPFCKFRTPTAWGAFDRFLSYRLYNKKHMNNDSVMHPRSQCRECIRSVLYCVLGLYTLTHLIRILHCVKHHIRDIPLSRYSEWR